MTRSLRDRDPTKAHLITCRTRNARLWLSPKKGLNDILGGVLARYQEFYEIDIYAYTYMGNHYHQLVQAPLENLHRYAEDINKQIASRVNRFFRRSGSLWGRRYDDQVVIEEVDIVEGFLYVMSNATKHGQVEYPWHWPGINSWWHALDGKDRIYPFTHYTQYHQAKRRAESRGESVRRSDYQTKHVLKISTLPQYKGMTIEERKQRLLPLLEERVKKLREERRKEGSGFQGRKSVMAQVPGSFPSKISRTPRPSCYTKNLEAKKQHRKEYRIKRAWYTDVSIKYRGGELGIEFPPYTFRPPLHHVPKSIVQSLADP